MSDLIPEISLSAAGPALVYVSEGSTPTVAYPDRLEAAPHLTRRDRAIAGALVALAQEHLDRADTDEHRGVHVTPC